MAGGDRSGADAALIAALASGLTVQDAATTAHVGERTARRRLEDPAFRRQVADARAALLEQAIGRLVDATTEAADTLRALLSAESEFVRIDDKDTEVEGPTPIEWKGETLYPKSRTFIPAKLADKLYLSSDPDYRATLQALPELLRSQLLYGDLSIGLEDDEWQVIPTSWVRAAQARWHEGRGNAPLAAIGVDVAQGGRDSTTLARRYGGWVAEIEAHPGAQVLDAGVNAGHAREALAEGGTS